MGSQRIGLGSTKQLFKKTCRRRTAKKKQPIFSEPVSRADFHEIVHVCSKTASDVSMRRSLDLRKDLSERRIPHQAKNHSHGKKVVWLGCSQFCPFGSKFVDCLAIPLVQTCVVDSSNHLLSKFRGRVAVLVGKKRLFRGEENPLKICDSVVTGGYRVRYFPRKPVEWFHLLFVSALREQGNDFGCELAFVHAVNKLLGGLFAGYFDVSLAIELSIKRPEPLHESFDVFKRSANRNATPDNKADAKPHSGHD